MKAFYQLGMIAALALLLSIPAQAQKRSLRAFCREYRGQAEIHTIAIGGPIIRLASWIIPKQDEDAIMAKRLLRKIRHFKLYTLTVDPNAVVSVGAMERLRARLEAEHFESLADVRSDGAVVHVMSKGSADDLGNVVLMVKDDEDIVFISLRTRLKLADVSDIFGKIGSSHLHNAAPHDSIAPVNTDAPHVDSAATVAMAEKNRLK